MRLFILKKSSLDSDDLSNYRPIFLIYIALSFVSKWLERAVHAQLHSILMTMTCSLLFIESFNWSFLTETTVLKIVTVYILAAL